MRPWTPHRSMTLKHLVATFWLRLTLCWPTKLVAQLRLASLPSCRLLSLALPSNAFTVRFFISAESFPRTLKNVSSVSPSFFFLMISRTCSKEGCALSRNRRFCGANLPSPLMLISFEDAARQRRMFFYHYRRIWTPRPASRTIRRTLRRALHWCGEWNCCRHLRLPSMLFALKSKDIVFSFSSTASKKTENTTFKSGAVL